jgi:TolB-like protein/DNA-binding SARP family transcriptional activator/Flp pilus assembly protein TadD
MDTASASGSGIEGPARWSLRLFGGFELSFLPGGERVTALGKRERVLLAYLALSPNCRQQRRKLATLLWGDSTDETALDNLRTCVWRLRKALSDSDHRLIVSEGEDTVLHAAAFEVDALAFRRLAGRSGRNELEAAANLYAGEFLDELGIESEEYETWRRAEATRFREQAIDVLSRLMTGLGECGETERAIQIGQRILTLEPLHDAAVRRLMRLYGESGRRGAAAHTYHALGDALRTELHAKPEAETRAVFAEIARGGEERTNAPAAADAKGQHRSTSRARARDTTGERPRPQTGLAPAPGQVEASRLGWILAGGLAAVIAVFLFQQFAPSRDTTTAQQQTDVEAAKAVSSAPTGAISIAVLPFANLSDDRQQEFFSDGMTDEITSALAKVSGLRLVGRSSAFQFKGQNRDLHAIGQALKARYLIGGSVRKQGTRVRITAQLVRAEEGIALWTETYDRELTDIFAIQEDIAQAIAGALRVPLGLQQGDRLVANRTIDPESYEQYLRVKAMIRPRGLEAITDGVARLEQIVARSRDFAPAWALLAVAYHLMPLQSAQRPADELRRLVDLYDPKSEAAARRAIQLDPNLADAYWALGFLQLVQRNLAQAEDLYSKALSLDPVNPDVLAGYSNFLEEVGRLKEGLAARQRIVALEPFLPRFNANLANALWYNGQDAAAITILKDFSRNAGDTSLARIYAAMGRYNEAADVLMAIPPGTYPDGMLEAAVRLLRTAPTATASPQSLPQLEGDLDFVYLHAGAPSRVLQSYEAQVQGGVFVGVGRLWHPFYAPVRKTERFKTLVRNTGLVDYWRERGWPASCRPMGADDFVCD